MSLLSLCWAKRGITLVTSLSAYARCVLVIDVVAKSMPGRLVILAMICVGVVLIPAQAAQLYNEVVSRRVIRGMMQLLGMSGEWILILRFNH